MKKKSVKTGLIILGILCFLSVFVPLISPYSYSEQNVSIQNLGVSWTHLFGTDKFGRDIFVRVFMGTRISLLVGILSTAVNLVIGITVGGTAGYRGGRIDGIFMRTADMIAAIPSLLYVILLTLVLGANVWSIIAGICISGWIPLARVVRGEIMRLKEQEFCMAAKVAGASDRQILWKHLMRNAVNPIIVNTTLMIPNAIYTESFLSFVGVGISAPMASLGTLIQEARSQIQVYPMQIIYPIIVLCTLIIGLNLIGNGLEKTK